MLDYTLYLHKSHTPAHVHVRTLTQLTFHGDLQQIKLYVHITVGQKDQVLNPGS